MRKIAAVTAVLVIGTGALTACSGSADAYCDELKSNQDSVKADDDPSKSLDLMKKVRDKAPSQVKGDWDTLIDFVEKTEAAKGDTTKTADLAKDASKVTTATQNISKHAKDSCKIDIPTA